MDQQKKIQFIYNKENILVDSNIINNIFKKCKINYTPNNINIYQIALTHKSYIYNDCLSSIKNIDNCVPLQKISNERLEFIGDSIIGVIISTYLFHRYNNQNEGFLTKLKTKIVRTNMLSKFSMYLFLDKYILISKYIEDSCKGRSNERILEDVFESFIGAMFEDIYNNNYNNYGKAMQLCYNFLINLLELTTDFQPLISINDNYKELLLQYYHKIWNGIHPIYKKIKEEIKMDKKFFTVEICHPINNKVIGVGEDIKKNISEQKASKMALDYFNVNPEKPKVQQIRYAFFK